MKRPNHQLWAEFRFGVIGSLLSNPPAKNELQQRLRELAETVWTHPINQSKLRLSFSTIERWYYKSINQNEDPLEGLRRKKRSDFGKTRLTVEMRAWLEKSYLKNPRWSKKCHADRLKGWLKGNFGCEIAPSYSTVLRYMRNQGWEQESGK